MLVFLCLLLFVQALLSAWYPPQPAAEPAVQNEEAKIKRRLSLITQQSGGGPADEMSK